MPLLQINEIQLYYEVAGTGEPLLLIHGWNCFLPVWKYVRSRLQRYCHLILPELRGHGRSTKLTKPTSIEVLTHDLIGLLDFLEINSCLVMGHSLGGFIAQQLALEVPKRVRALILACTGSKVIVDAVQNQNWEDQLTFGLSPEEAVEKRMGFDFYDPNKLRTIPGMMKLLREDEAQRQINLISHGFVAAAALQFNSEGWLKKIRAPTLIIQGAQDPLFPISAGQSLHTHIPNSTLRIIDKTGHSIQLEQPQALVEAIVKFSQAL